MKFCINCKQNVEPELKGGVDYKGLMLVMALAVILGTIWIALIVVLACAVVQQIYGESPKDVCPICKASDFRKETKEEKREAV